MSRRGRRGGHTARPGSAAAAKQKNNTIGYALIAAMALAVATFLYFRLTSSSIGPIDQATWCPADKFVPAQLTILVDQTDSISPAQARSIKSKVLDLVIGNKPRGVVGLPKHGRVELFVLAEEGLVDKPVLVLCNPGDGTDISELTGNPTLAARHWRQRFEEPFNLALDRVLTIGEAKTSPILEAVQAINVHASDELRKSERLEWRELVVVSDMLQHSKFSLYDEIPKVSEFTKRASFPSVFSDLSDTNVVVLFIHRPKHEELGVSRFREFWANLFAAFGVDANQFQWEPIEG